MDKDPFSKEAFGVSLRRATLADAPRILELQKKVSSPHAYVAVSLEDIEDDIRNVVVNLIESGGVVVGSVTYEKTDDHAFIASLHIDPSVQSGGVGRAALEMVLQELKDCARVEAQTGENNKPMLELAQKLGFVVAGKTKGGDDQTILNLVRVKKSLEN